uniref:Uncharacterized protein n=1 Tax=Panagrolaimus sp. ES5 TaxID=591445 RepID=A0AC34FRW0_9BILA
MMQNIPPNLIKQASSYCTRILYINLGAGYEANRSNLRSLLHKKLIEEGWESTNDTTSYFYYIRNDKLNDKDLEETVKRAILKTNCHDFQFALLQPVFVGNVEDNCDGFAGLFKEKNA